MGYITNTTDEAAAKTDSGKIKRIHETVKKVKISEKTGVKYMQLWEEKAYMREEAYEEGHGRGLEDGRAEGLKQGLEEGLKQGLEEGLKQGLEEGLKQGLEEGLKQGLEEGLEQGMEQGLTQGAEKQLIRIVCKKLGKGKTMEEIADEVEESLELVEEICLAAQKEAPDYDCDKIYARLREGERRKADIPFHK